MEIDIFAPDGEQNSLLLGGNQNKVAAVADINGSQWKTGRCFLVWSI